MLNRYHMHIRLGVVYAETESTYGLARAISGAGWVRYADAEKLELRIRELEQQLMTEAEKRAAFEKDCG